MGRLAASFCIAVIMAMVGAVPAQAATTSVTGAGSYQKLVVINGANNLVFKIHAPGGKCAVRYIRVTFRDRDGTAYQMDAGCYPGAVWDANVVRGDAIVACPDFTFRYNADKGIWTATIPRTCLNGLASAVKVTESFVDDYSPNPGEVPATQYVSQG